MRIGWNGGGNYSNLEAIRKDARRAAQEGFSHFWLSQIMGPDSLTALAAIGADAPGIELGVSRCEPGILTTRPHCHKYYLIDILS